MTTKRPKSTLHRRAETRLNRLILNQTRLNSNLHRMYPDFHPSPVCACGNSIADREHFLLHCTIHSASREKLFDQIDKGYHDTKTHFHLRSLNMERLIGPNNDLTPEMKLIIQRSVGSFLLSTLSTDIWAAFTTKPATSRKFYLQKSTLAEISYLATISTQNR